MASRGFPITQAIRQERRKQAEARQAEYDKLSIQQKLDRLPPEPQAAKQRAKLLKQQEAEKVKAAQKATPKPEATENINKKTQKKSK